MNTECGPGPGAPSTPSGNDPSAPPPGWGCGNKAQNTSPAPRSPRPLQDVAGEGDIQDSWTEQRAPQGGACGRAAQLGRHEPDPRLLVQGQRTVRAGAGAGARGKVTGEVERRPGGQLNMMREDGLPTGTGPRSLVHTHTRAHTLSRWLKCRPQGGRKTSLLTTCPSLHTGLGQQEGRRRHRPLLECTAWLLWVKPPTCCFWKGWCPGCDLCWTCAHCPGTPPPPVPPPEALQARTADVAAWMRTSPGQALEARRTD